MTPQPPGPENDDTYVVDTRRRPRRPSRPARSSASVTIGQGRRAGGPPREPGDPESPGGARERRGPREPRHRGRVSVRSAVVIGLVLVLAWVTFLVWVPARAWSNVPRVDATPAGDRPAEGSGRNYVLVGSDSREGLTPAQRNELTTGSAEGRRTDTIMLVHVSQNGGKPVLVSIPRDSYVPIPGHGRQKINAAYSIGGAKLLNQTLEQATGIHIDGYVEIGLGGFATMVEAVGGVNVCVKTDMVDPKAGINLKEGCQVLDGKNALGYVRSRYVDPLGDIGRAARQRQFLSALMRQAATPSTVLLPWRYKGFVDASVGGLTVGEDTSLLDAYRVMSAMRAVSADRGLSLAVPTSSTSFQTPASGVAVKWDTEKALALFTALRDDEPLTEPPAGTVPEGSTAP